MKQFKVIVAVLIMSLALASSSVDTSFLNTNARAVGLGNAYSALSDDYGAAFSNPAGLTQVQTVQVGIMQNSLFGLLNTFNGAITLPMDDMTFALALIHSGMDGLQPSTQTIYGLQANGSAVSYQNTSILGSWAMDLNQTPWSVGLTGKLIMQSAGSLYNASALNANAGAMYKLSPVWKLSAAYHNFLPFKLNVKDGGNDNMDSKLTLGTRFQIAGNQQGNFIYLENQTLDLMVDLDFQNNQLNTKIGAEFKPFKVLSLRGGLSLEQQAANASSTEMTQKYSLGVGLDFNGLRFDYAFALDPNAIDDNNTHYFSMLFDVFHPKATPEIQDYVSVKTPEDQTVTYQNLHRVLGSVMPGVAKVKVNGQVVELQNNRFITAIKFMRYGKQRIRIQAYNDQGDLIEEELIRMLYMASFVDLPPQHWAKQYGEELATLGLIDIDKNNPYFMPNKTCTRAELARAIVLMKGMEVDEAIRWDVYSFEDILEHPYRNYIELAYRQRLMLGYSESIFAPDDLLNREQVVATLVRVDQLPVPAQPSQSRFRDMKVKRWSTRYVETAVNADQVNGYEDGTFRPSRKVSRAELAKMLYNTKLGQSMVQDLFDWESYK